MFWQTDFLYFQDRNEKINICVFSKGLETGRGKLNLALEAVISNFKKYTY